MKYKITGEIEGKKFNKDISWNIVKAIYLLLEKYGYNLNNLKMVEQTKMNKKKEKNQFNGKFWDLDLEAESLKKIDIKR